MDDRLLPQDLDAEMALLGSMMVAHLHPGLAWTIDDVRAIVGGPEAFHADSDHIAVYRCLCESIDAGEPKEFVALQPRLRATDPGRDWAKLCTDLSESYADPGAALHYAEQVRKCHRLRKLIGMTDATNKLAYSALADPVELAGALTNRLEKLDDVGAADGEPQHEAALLRQMQHAGSESGRRVPVGLGWLGSYLGGGFDRGSLTVIGARPSCGKTSLALGLATDASGHSDGCPCLFVSAEMTARQVAERLLSMRSRVSMNDIRTGKIGPYEFTQAQNRYAALAESEAGVYVLDRTTNVRAIVGFIRRYVRQHEIGLAIIDYLGLLTMPGNYERNDLRVGEIAKTFKAIAQELDVAVVLLCQLSRASATQNRAPILSDLRDSGDIEAHADVVIMAHRGADTPDVLAETTLYVRKNRQGSTGDVKLFYNKSTMSFEVPYISTGGVPF